MHTLRLPGRDQLRLHLRRRAQFLRILWWQLGNDKVLIRASGLSFATLLATVPLVAVLVALLTAFSAFDQLTLRVRDFLLAQVLPTSQERIISYIDQFTANTSKLGFIGFVFLVLTAILLLDSIERSFNDIWHVRASRRLVYKITAYTSVLVFATVLIGASVSISARIKSLLMVGSTIDVGLLTRIGSWLFPLLLSFLAFLLMYLVIPHARVRLASAVGGAGVAAILWEVAKSVFAISVGRSVQYSTIYGSLAVVPIFLVWLYITWLIILLGLEIAHTHQHFDALLRGRGRPLAGAGERVFLGLKVFTSIAHRFRSRHRPPLAVDLADELGAPVADVEEAVRLLAARGLVRQLADDGDGGGVVPAGSLHRITVSEVVRAIFPSVVHDPPPAAPLEREVEALLAAFQEAGYSAIGATTIEELLERTGGGGPLS